ncbi:hypothetical protein [Parendozoicomonas sp. Alg238-R29]|uniref:hypothetical protein n=1 Tax=Parendozoicomonas sp. Alg238-R29 TaxID=2993446 RepID=UPI00248EDE79|nr:hypothetical protein [Parendozoicomonas sp. Alg238-R29]
MQLIKLTIYKKSEAIREIPFKDGLNIVTNNGLAGNQLGKSTFLRAINFCLGSDGESLWKDPENGNINHEIKNLLLSGEITFQLIFRSDGITYTIVRILQEVQQKSRVIVKKFSWINDVEYHSHTKFKQVIGSIFGCNSEKPKYNSIKNRYVRISRPTANNAYKYLTFFTSDDEYSLIHSYIFGFQGIEKLKLEIEIKNEISIAESRKSAILNGSTLRFYKDKLAAIDEEILLLQEKEEKYDLSGIHNDALDKLKVSRENIARLSSDISNLETRILYNQKTITQYEEKVSSIDVSTVENIYNEAKILIPDITKTLQETIDFHNSIFLRKAEFVKTQSAILENQLINLKANLTDSLNSEKTLTKDLANEGHLSGFILIEREIQEQKEKRGSISYVIDEVKELESYISSKSNDLSEIKREIESLLEGFNKNLDVFNIFYSKITQDLFTTHRNRLNADTNDKGELSFSIINDNLNTGDGVPRVSSMAFDMSLVKFNTIFGSKLPKFTIQDYLESADEEKLEKLFNVANSENIQAVVAILNDKLSFMSSSIKKENTILELSETDKFFKV